MAVGWYSTHFNAVNARSWSSTYCCIKRVWWFGLRQKIFSDNNAVCTFVPFELGPQKPIRHFAVSCTFTCLDILAYPAINHEYLLSVEVLTNYTVLCCGGGGSLLTSSVADCGVSFNSNPTPYGTLCSAPTPALPAPPQHVLLTPHTSTRKPWCDFHFILQGAENKHNNCCF